MGADEEGTRAAMRSLRDELWEPKAKQFGGRIVKTTGDGQLLEFPSVVEALKYAVELQQGMAERNVDVQDERRIELRIGVNLGDIIVEDDDIHGDGVNVAARLEGLAETGGICVSGTVHEFAKGKLNLGFEDHGEQKVKNIAEPVQTYRVDFRNYVPVVVASSPSDKPDANRRWLVPAISAAAVLIIVIGGGLIWWQPWVTRVEAANVADMALPLPDKPSIAVLPFVNLSGGSEHELLPDGITEDITTALSRLPSFFVISRTTTSTYKGKSVTVKQVAEDLGVQFVLEGSVQRDGDRMRVTAQLIDALSGRHIWADRYDRDMTDLFAVQDEIALNVVSNIGAELQTGEADRISRRDTNSLDAWLLVREATEEFEKLTPEGLALARSYLERAIVIDPGFVSAHAFLAATHSFEGELGYTDPDEAFDKAFTIATRAMNMNPSSANAFVGLSHVYRVRGEVDLAVDAVEKAVALEPNDFDARGTLAYTIIFAGRAKEAVEQAKLAIRLSPVTPDWVHAALGEAHLLSGDLEEAEAVFEALLERKLPAPLESLVLARLALVLAATGREQEAREAVRQAVKLFPQASISYEKAGNPFKDPSITEQRSETWRRLGMPEGKPPGAE